MKRNAMFLAVLVVTCSALCCVDSAAAQEPEADSNVAVSAPPEPIKNLKKQIWEGYYNAQVHYIYHLNAAQQLRTAEDDERHSGVWWTVIGFAIPLALASFLPDTWQNARWYKAAAAIFGVAAFTFGINSMIESTKGQSLLHDILADEWQQMANEWKDARTLRTTDSPEQLEQLIIQLRSQQKHVDSIAPPELYDKTKLREAQHELNHSLGLEPKPSA